MRYYDPVEQQFTGRRPSRQPKRDPARVAAVRRVVKELSDHGVIHKRGALSMVAREFNLTRQRVFQVVQELEAESST